MLQLRLRIDRLRPFVDGEELLADSLVVWLVCVLEPLDAMEDILDCLVIFGLVPKVLFRSLEALVLDCFDFIHGVFLFLSPLELFFEEI